MADVMEQPSVDFEHHFTVLVRIPIKRGDFLDPPPVAWSAAKERELWSIISRPSKGNEINWKVLAETFRVSQQFLLQQAAWLYEKQLSQVRAQMRRVGTVQSNSSSPTPGSTAGSVLGAQAMRRTGSGGSRVPSRLSIRQRDSPIPRTEGESTSVKPRAPQLSRTISGNRGIETSKLQESPNDPSKQATKETLPRRQTSRPSCSHQKSEVSVPASPPLQESSSETSSSDDDQVARTRRHPPSRYRRGIQQRPQSFIRPSLSDDDDDDDEERSPPFLPFAATLPRSESSQDPGATLRGDLKEQNQNRPSTLRRATSERISSSLSTQGQSAVSPTSDLRPAAPLSTIESSATSSSSSNTPAPPPRRPPQQQLTAGSRQTNAAGRTGPLSPRQAAALNAAGLSPRLHRGASNTNPASREGQGSDGTGTPSMGSSFSDLDDTSVTQSALEEALLSNMQQGGNGNSTNGPGMASRMSTISQALRSRYL